MRDVSFLELVSATVIEQRKGATSLIDVDTIIGTLHRQVTNITLARTDNGTADHEKILNCMVKISAALQIAAEFTGMTLVKDDDFELEDQLDNLRGAIRKFATGLTNNAQFGTPRQKGGEAPLILKIDQQALRDMMNENFGEVVV